MSAASQAVRLRVLQQDAGRVHRLALFNRAILQVLEGERDADIPHGEFGTRQIKELAGSLRTAGRPALSKHKKRILYQNFNTDLWKQKQREREGRRN